MEIALWTKPDRVDKPDASGRIYRKPKGAVCVAITSEHIRAKWVEIVADLIRPERRGGAYRFNFAAAVQAVWKPEWYQTFRAMENGEITPDAAWATVSKVLPDLGKDPRGEVPRSDAWPWHQQERRQFYICKIDLEDADIAQQGDYTLDGKACKGYLYKVDYASNLGLGIADVQDIEDEDVLIHPKLTTMLAANKVQAVYDSIPEALKP